MPSDLWGWHKQNSETIRYILKLAVKQRVNVTKNQ